LISGVFAYPLEKVYSGTIEPETLRERLERLQLDLGEARGEADLPNDGHL
jgi:hypothetical protein